MRVKYEREGITYDAKVRIQLDTSCKFFIDKSYFNIE